MKQLDLLRDRLAVLVAVWGIAVLSWQLAWVPRVSHVITALLALLALAWMLSPRSSRRRAVLGVGIALLGLTVAHGTFEALSLPQVAWPLGLGLESGPVPGFIDNTWALAMTLCVGLALGLWHLATRAGGRRGGAALTLVTLLCVGLCFAPTALQQHMLVESRGGESTVRVLDHGQLVERTWYRHVTPAQPAILLFDDAWRSDRVLGAIARGIHAQGGATNGRGALWALQGAANGIMWALRGLAPLWALGMAVTLGASRFRWVGHIPLFLLAMPPVVNLVCLAGVVLFGLPDGSGERLWSLVWDGGTLASVVLLVTSSAHVGTPE